MYEYLRGCQPEWWIEAYFVTVMDGCKTTSNAAEQENNRFKAQGIRWMAPLDFLDAVCRLVTTVVAETAMQQAKRCIRPLPQRPHLF